jgi:hypothetical protein
MGAGFAPALFSSPSARLPSARALRSIGAELYGVVRTRMVLKGQRDFRATACDFLSRGKTGPADSFTLHRLAGSRRFALLQFGIVMEGGVRQARHFE